MGWAKGFDCILEHTGFRDWYSRRRCPESLKKLSGFRLLAAWIELVPGAADQCQRAIAQHYVWDPERRLIGYVPVRGVVYGRSRPGVFDRTTALLLQQRILDALAFGSCISIQEYEAMCQSFKRHSRVDLGNAWILSGLHHVGEACLVQLNTNVRRAKLTPEQQDRFECQRAPSRRKCAAQILAATRADLRTNDPGAAVPSWFNATYVLHVMDHYSFSQGGGHDG